MTQLVENERKRTIRFRHLSSTLHVPGLPTSTSCSLCLIVLTLVLLLLELQRWEASPRMRRIQSAILFAEYSTAFASEPLSSLNSYGYSPHKLSQYLIWIESILDATSSPKPFIISTTADDPESMQLAISAIQSLRTKCPYIGVEFNTSCPNIHESPPTGYTPRALVPILRVLAAAWAADPTLTLGLKLPPYVHAAQLSDLLDVLRALCTLEPGSGLAHQVEDAISPEFAVPTALGGLAGDSLHPLALGNVRSFAQALASKGPSSGLRGLVIVGIGGVTSAAAAARMRKAAASIVESATLFGKEGVRAFEILAGKK
ncbi:hypothetical protein C8F01DRAFT_1165689 [Mycena amicta]|nr:hypothetical protein C8F01DRAFT_1165689 [Mycena amicta]